MYCHHHDSHQTNGDRLCQNAMRFSAGANFLILLLKYYAWHKTNSLSYLSGFLEIAFDTTLSCMNVFLLSWSRRPASENFRFGFGKLEAMGALLQVCVVCYGGWWLFRESVERISHPESITNHGVGLIIIGVSTLVTICVVCVQRYALKRAKSLLVSSDAVHALGHLVLNLGIVVSLVLSAYNIWPLFDVLVGVCVALYMVAASYPICKQSLKGLLDAELSVSDRAELLDIMRAVPGVEGVHQMRTRCSGNVIFVQGHIELNPDITFRQSHEIAHLVEDSIQKKFPKAQVLLHQDIIGEEAHVADY